MGSGHSMRAMCAELDYSGLCAQYAKVIVDSGPAQYAVGCAHSWDDSGLCAQYAEVIVGIVCTMQLAVRSMQLAVRIAG